MGEHAEILHGLYGLRLPGLGIAEIAIALSLGLGVAALGALALTTFQPRTRRVSAAKRVTTAQALPDAERIMLLAELLRELTDGLAPGEDRWTNRATRDLDLPPDLMTDLDRALYHPDADIDVTALEQTVLRLARKAGA